MNAVDARFVMSTEQECMAFLEPSERFEQLPFALQKAMREIARAAPSVSCSNGIFNGYGRVYIDCGMHLELAAAECHSPYVLALLHDRQLRLAAQAAERASDETLGRLHLLNNNHDGLLHASSPTWGSHENYFVEQRPETFGAAILPFLASRLFGGAGGVHFPSGRFLAGARPVFLELDSGGETVRHRALHSTARHESLTAGAVPGFRYHLILGDGHRSPFNRALQFGATALALKAIFFDPGLAERVPARPSRPGPTMWLAWMRRWNVLARPGSPPRARESAVAVQRVYLDGARRWADSVADLPAWVPRTLADWQQTLDALARDDRPWLARRLDAFTKYELFDAFLREAGAPWTSLRRRRDLCLELAMLDQSYHDFTDSDSAYDRLDRAGALDARVGPEIAPGGEAIPFVPEVETRARARALLLHEQAEHTRDLWMDWSVVVDVTRSVRRDLHDPFATEFGPWKRFAASAEPTSRGLAELLHRIRLRRRSPPPPETTERL